MPNTKNAIGYPTEEGGFQEMGNTAPKVNMTADDISYDNSQSGASATNVQAAVDEAFSDLSELTTEVEVASVAATGKTYLTQFQAILTTFNTLTAEQKRNAVLMHEGERFLNDGSGTFFRIFANVNGLYIYCFSSSHVRFIRTNGSQVDAYDASSNSATMEMKLLTRG